MSEKVVVTGASGHIGFHVAHELCRQGYEVHLLIRSENVNVERLCSAGAVVHLVDLFQPGTFREVLQNASALFHLAAENTTDTSDESRVIKNSLDLTRSVLTAAVDAGINTIIYTSSVVVLGRSSDPNILITEKDKNAYAESPYVKGKMLAEDFCESLINKGIDIRRIYPSWVVGSQNAKLTPPHGIIQKAMLNGQPFYFDGGISIAEVHEVAKAHIAAWKIGRPRSQYVLGGANITFKELYTHLALINRRSLPTVNIPKWFIYLGSVAAKVVLGKRSPIDPQYVQSIIGRYSWYDSSTAEKELHYKIPAVSETLQQGSNEVRYHVSGLANVIQYRASEKLVRTKYADDDILLVTGFPGWLANRMVDVFMNGDHDGKYAIDRKVRLLVQPSFKHFRFDLPKNFEIVYGDLKEKQSIASALNGVKAVYHCAGVIYPPKIQTLYDVNWTGTKNLVDACIENGVKRIIYMGTDSICGFGRGKKVFDENEKAHPYKNYGMSKYLAEQYILQKTKDGFIDGTSLRGFWFFGPHMPLRNQSLILMMKWKRQIIFGDGKNIRSLTHIDNVIQAFIKSEKSSSTIGKWYWMSDKDHQTTIDQIFQTMAEKMGLNYKPIYIPKFICELLSVADILLGQFGILNATIHAAGKFHKDIAGGHTSAKRDFDLEPIGTFDHFLDDIGHFYKKP
ncbi:MAG: NAD-dependent epimerase/dehydratase family protein [Bacteroidota bacterium]